MFFFRLMVSKCSLTLTLTCVSVALRFSFVIVGGAAVPVNTLSAAGAPVAAVTFGTPSTPALSVFGFVNFSWHYLFHCLTLCSPTHAAIHNLRLFCPVLYSGYLVTIP